MSLKMFGEKLIKTGEDTKSCFNFTIAGARHLCVLNANSTRDFRRVDVIDVLFVGSTICRSMSFPSSARDLLQLYSLTHWFDSAYCTKSLHLPPTSLTRKTQTVLSSGRYQPAYSLLARAPLLDTEVFCSEIV